MKPGVKAWAAAGGSQNGGGFVSREAAERKIAWLKAHEHPQLPKPSRYEVVDTGTGKRPFVIISYP